MTKGSEAAFPVADVRETNGSYMQMVNPGMTKREVMAMAAMQGILASDVGDKYEEILVARMAIGCADALLAELSKEKD